MSIKELVLQEIGRNQDAGRNPFQITFNESTYVAAMSECDALGSFDLGLVEAPDTFLGISFDIDKNPNAPDIVVWAK